MNASELAKMLLQWEQMRRRLDELEEAISDSVLQIGKTQTVGNVRAKYSAGRRSYDYRQVGEDAPAALVEQYTEIVPETTKTDWRKLVLDGMGIDQDQVPHTQGEPSVNITLEG